MVHVESSVYCARIVNCLQTILDLEPILQRMESGHIILSEFKVIKSFLTGMDGVVLDEDDVARIESATERFLQELNLPATLSAGGETPNLTLQ